MPPRCDKLQRVNVLSHIVQWGDSVVPDAQPTIPLVSCVELVGKLTLRLLRLSDRQFVMCRRIKNLPQEACHGEAK